MIPILISIIVFILFLSVVEAYAQSRIDSGKCKNYYIGQNEDGKYYIYGKWCKLTGTPEELASGHGPNSYKTEAEARKALREFLRKKLITRERNIFAQTVDVADVRSELVSELATERIRELIAEQERAQAETEEKIRQIRGSAEALEKTESQPNRRTKVAV